MTTPGSDATFTTGTSANFYASPLWKFLITKTLTPSTDPAEPSSDGTAGQVVTTLQRIGMKRTVTRVLNAPCPATAEVPSDNIRVYLTDADDGFPKVAEGVRDLIGLRRENTDPPFYVVRYAGTIDQINDCARQDDARSTITAHDPWQYMNSRPVRNGTGGLPGQTGLSYSATKGNVIALQLLENTINADGPARIDLPLAYGGTAYYTGTIEDTDQLDIIFQQGMMVGEAWTELVKTNTMDIVLEPIYDPINRPGVLAQISIYAQAGTTRYNKIFGWNAPPRSVVDLSRLIDGTQRATSVQFGLGQGGPYATAQEDAQALATYGSYWALQFLPGQTVAAAVNALAQLQLQLRKDGKTTVAVSPAPERSPRPFVDYDIGDRLPVNATAQGFRQALNGLIRVYGIPLNISDDALESVESLLVAEATS